MNRSREFAELLLRKAQGDAWMLNRAVSEQGAPPWALGFHAQQAVEKAIKAVLTVLSVEYPRTHNLALLMDLLRQRGQRLPPDAAELPRLTPFGALLRYDEDQQFEASPVQVDRAWMRNCVERTLAWAEKAIAPGPTGGS